jgi:tight adherence protein B
MMGPEIIPGLPNDVLALLAGATVILPASLAFAVAQHSGQRAQLRARVEGMRGADGRSARPRQAAKRTRQIKSKLQETGHAEDSKAARRVQLRLRIERAGLVTSLRTFYLLSVLSAALGTSVYLALGYPPLFTPAVAAVLGIGLPRAALNWLAKRRQRRFTQHFADAIDVIVRGIRSGLPVSECLQIIARESPDPVGGEFKLLVEGQRLGMTLKQALARACRRMPTADMKFFAVVLNLQNQTGGNLAETLAGLSGVLRGRKKMADKIRAMSAEARLTATIIGVLPFLISFVIYVLNPGYILLLWTDPLGNLILYGGLLWMAIGIFIMKQMVSFEI